MDIHCRLIVLRGGEHLALPGRDGGIPLNQLGCDSAHGLDGKRQRRDIQQKNVACSRVALKLSALNAGTDRNALIRIKDFSRFSGNRGVESTKYTKKTLSVCLDLLKRKNCY